MVCPDPAPAQRGRSQPLAQSPCLSPGRLHTKQIICEHGDGQHQLPHPGASKAPGDEKPEQKAFARPGHGHGAGHAARAPPPRGRGHRTNTAKETGSSKRWFSATMTQPLHGQCAETSDSPSSEGLHGQSVVGNGEPRWLRTPCPGTPESQRPHPRQDRETNAVIKPQGTGEI